MKTVTNSVQLSGENIFISPSLQYPKESPSQYLSRNFLTFSSPAQTVVTSSNTLGEPKANFRSSMRTQSSFTSLKFSSTQEGAKHSAVTRSKPLISRKFSKMPPPSSNSQIDVFVKNLLDYLSTYQPDQHAAVFLKTKLLTRYEDFRATGLERNYFVLSLYRMQKELISLICKEDESLVIHTSL